MRTSIYNIRYSRIHLYITYLAHLAGDIAVNIYNIANIHLGTCRYTLPGLRPGRAYVRMCMRVCVGRHAHARSPAKSCVQRFGEAT